MGAAFDDALIKDVATVISTEARAFNNDDRAGKQCEMNSEFAVCLQCDYTQAWTSGLQTLTRTSLSS